VFFSWEADHMLKNLEDIMDLCDTPFAVRGDIKKRSGTILTELSQILTLCLLC